MLKTHYKKVLATLALLGIVYLWFGGIMSSDLYSDNALNSFRAYGWFDRLLGGQYAPIDWLGSIPGWATLSFHDAPPLVFFSQFISFFLFGGSPFSARLPFILAGILSITAIYFFIKKIFDKERAIIAAGLFAINSYAIWAGLAGYLEGVEQLFITLSLFSLFLYATEKKPDPRWLYMWSASTALACMSKYTAVFIFLPALIVFIQHRATITSNLRIKNWIIAAGIFVAIISPVLVYNTNMYAARGHFDAALSSIVGMHPQDFYGLSNRSVEFSPLTNLAIVARSFVDNNSYPFTILAILSLLWLIVRCIKRSASNFEIHVLLFIGSYLLMAAFFKSSPRFNSILTPLVSIAMALAIWDWKEKIKGKQIATIFFVTFIGICSVCELFYAINTNILITPIGKSGTMYSSSKPAELGFNELDTYLRTNVLKPFPAKQTIRSLKDLNFVNKDVAGRSIVVYDDRINWFAQNWYFIRYLDYHKWPLVSDATFLPDGGGLDITAFAKVSGKDFYFIYPLADNILDTARVVDKSQADLTDVLIDFFTKEKIEAIIIKNKAGADAFKIYKISSERLLKVQ